MRSFTININVEVEELPVAVGLPVQASPVQLEKG